jgi:hypothetical protein
MKALGECGRTISHECTYGMDPVHGKTTVLAPNYRSNAPLVHFVRNCVRIVVESVILSSLHTFILTYPEFQLVTRRYSPALASGFILLLVVSLA